MKRILTIVVLSLATYCFASESDQTARLYNALSRYEFFTGKNVEVSAALKEYASESAPHLRRYYYNYGSVEDIETTLKNANIGLFQISSNRTVATWIEPNYSAAREFVEKCKRDKKIPGIFRWGRFEARNYMNTTPELVELQKEWNKAGSELSAILMQFEEYRRAKEKDNEARRNNDRRVREQTEKELGEAYLKVTEEIKDREDYKVAKQKNHEAQLRLNIRTLEIMLDDYESQGKYVPTAWMNSDS
jgi:hypothetical protein